MIKGTTVYFQQLDASRAKQRYRGGLFNLVYKLQSENTFSCRLSLET